MSNRRPTLFVTGFPPETRAKDLAVIFEKYGEIIRCDVPAPAAGRSTRYAFIEYVNEDDAGKAHSILHGEIFEGGKLIVEWAKRSPGSRWRPGGAPPPPREGGMRDSRGYGDRDRDRDRPRGDYRDRDRRDDRDRDMRRSRSPPRRGDRERPRDDRDRGDRPERAEYVRRVSPPRGDRRRDDGYREREREMDMPPMRRSATPPPPKGVYENGRY
ncbi:hypothetical protein M408DRAFT_330476 [Serendipita vermifera MAFF 305830]|uniref:RRM domain-containing protein n=1 Tax=Serendipita vermifera MAFF 305830 TaxID=933852 RepID=A0A0C3B3G4_SERVB|nr:hypothetical protein M408DRAFT_330476 [Serendipita vermifera MAFF 305830]